jgi:hypothetical protein
MSPGFARFSVYFGFAMIALYLLAGIMLICTNFLIDLIPSNRLLFGGIIIVYALFRFYMTFRMFKRMRQPNKDE